VPNPVLFKNNVQRQNSLNAANNNQNNNLADWNFMIAQYRIFCSQAKDSEIEDALSSSDFRVRFAAVLVAGEKNLEIGNKIFDLLADDNKFIQQAARRSLSVKSYFLIKEIKEVNFTTEQKNKIKPVVNVNNLKIGLDYVDFGPMLHDSIDLSNHSAFRWRSWFSIRENELRDLKKILKDNN